jgi:hypothetical protein
VAAIAVLGLTAFAPGARAAVTVGALSPDADPVNCVPNATFMQGGADGTSPSWDAPAAGVITSWRTNAGSATDTDAGLRVFRPTVDPDVFTVVANGPLQDLTPSALNVFQTRISVQAGDRIAIATGPNGGGPCVWDSGLPADTIRFRSGPPTAAGMTETLLVNNPTSRTNVSAQLEPDGDRDDWGDETQDKCPGVPGPEEGCPDNDFTIGKQKKLKSGSVLVDVTVPGPGVVSAVDARQTRKKKMGRVASRSVEVAAAGTIQVRITFTAGARRTLNKTGRSRASVRFTFTPTGFTPKAGVVRIVGKKRK